MKKHTLLDGFRNSLPISFEDMELLQKVFVHRSFLNEREAAALKLTESNERLEFLGDAVLSNAISHMLYKKFPDIDEGELTKLRAKLVNRHMLARIAKKLCLNDYLLLGKGERNSGGADNPTILAGAFEALIAAVYFEHGFKGVFSYIDTLFSSLIDTAHLDHSHFDYKPRLQELAQKVFKEAPVYRLVKEDGPAHRKRFEVEVMITGEIFGTGSAAKKKDAEQFAAGEALKKLKLKYREHFPEPHSKCPGKNSL